MKPQTWKTPGLLALMFVALFACQKEKPRKSRTELLTALPWKFYVAGLDLNNDGTIDTTLRPDLVPVCSTDNMFTFYKDSTGFMDDNRIFCAGPKISPFTWNFLKDETEFYMSVRPLPIYEGTSKIVELTDSRFTITRQVGVHGFPSYLTFVIIMIH